MGTRHLIAVQLDGEYKVAQYGQWDGYPSGQGKDILSFLKEKNLQVFTTQVRKCRWMDETDDAAITKRIEAEGLQNSWPKLWPHLSRDAGSDILTLIYEAPEGLALKNQIDFAGDSLMCEWAYVIDLDKNVLEVFEGFNKSPLDDGERFKDLPKQEEYYPVRLVASFPLSDLPSLEDFIKACDPQEVE